MTAACADESLSHQEKKMLKESTTDLSDKSSLTQENKLNQNNNIEKSNVSPVEEELNIKMSCSDICSWEDNDDETQSSIESLESPGLLSEGGNNTSSGYNSFSNEGKNKSKRDSDTSYSAASSSSDAGDLNISGLKNSIDEIIITNRESKKIIIMSEKKIIYDPDDGEKFHKAVRNGDVDGVVELIANGFIQDLNEPDWNVSGDPPLLVAATNHCLPVLR